MLPMDMSLPYNHIRSEVLILHKIVLVKLSLVFKMF